jgi:hypothetical protein
MYSFAQRPDTIVLDEPFYGIYLGRSGANHPGADEVISSMPGDEETVLKNIFRQWPRPVLFIKNMAHHIEVLDRAFLRKTVDVFLIRNPRQIIASYAEVIQELRMRDIGIEYQYELYQQLIDEGERPVVVDSGLLLENPRSVLSELCNTIGIDFSESMLQWPAGPKPYDGIWAPHWYANVHRSTGFEKQVSSSRPLPPNFMPLYEKAAVYYEKLLSFAIQP